MITSPTIPLSALFTLCAIDASAQRPDWPWARSGVGQDYDQASAVATDPSGNVNVSGYFASDSIAFGGDMLLNNTTGFDALFIVKYGPDGSVLRAHGIGGDSNDKAFSARCVPSTRAFILENAASRVVDTS